MKKYFSTTSRRCLVLTALILSLGILLTTQTAQAAPLTATVSFNPSIVPTGSTTLATVLVRDNGVPVAGAAVSLVVKDGAVAVWSSPAAVNTDSSGNAYFSTGPYSNQANLTASANVTYNTQITTGTGGLTVSNVTAQSPASSTTSTSGSTSAGSVSIPSPIACKDATCLAGQVIRYILGVIAIIATLMFVWGGVMMLTSGGNADQVKKAKETLVWAAIGVIVILLSWAIIQFVLKGIAGTSR